MLKTLGGLRLEGTSFSRLKPLLLLAYLALEGPKERRHLAELFYLDAADALNSLSTALSRLRQAAPHKLQASAQFADGVFFVPLESLVSAEGVP